MVRRQRRVPGMDQEQVSVSLSQEEVDKLRKVAGLQNSPAWAEVSDLLAESAANWLEQGLGSSKQLVPLTGSIGLEEAHGFVRGYVAALKWARSLPDIALHRYNARDTGLVTTTGTPIRPVSESPIPDSREEEEVSS